MSDKPFRRLAAMAGLAIGAAFAMWWLGSVRLAIDRGADAGKGAADALQMVWIVRALLVPVLAVRVAALSGWSAGATAALAIVAPSWPVLVLAWAASTTTIVELALAEGLLLAAALALPLVGVGLRRPLPRADLVEPIASAVGVVLAAAVWFVHDRWAFPSGF